MKTNNLDRIATHPVQTSAWAEFRGGWGNEIIETKYGLITVHSLPFTKYKVGNLVKALLPTPEMLKDLVKLGKEKNIIFMKLEPNYPIRIDGISQTNEKALIKLLKTRGAVRGKNLFNPSTFWIDLTPSEEELLKSFSSKTRYNIRVAQKHGVMVKEDNSEKAFERYLDLTRETTIRQKFYAHTESYHRLMWKVFRKAGIAHMLTAKYKGQIITTWILFVWKDFLYYPYGASTDEHRQVMANNLMMWEAIKFGKEMGLKTFDLWGRDEGKGFTKFKEGYNPHVVEFLGTWDLVINPFAYKVYRLAEKLRWITLRLAAKLGLSKYRF
jgi:lipid II:glycine glycyltransferase (peptidoglycan interpeptide bridge formation enzyme)